MEQFIDIFFFLLFSLQKSKECVANFVGILMGIGLVMCILYVYVYGRALFMYPRCGNVATDDDQQLQEHISYHTDEKRISEYVNWIRRGSEDGGCGVDCLHWDPDITVQTEEQEALVYEKLSDPYIVQDDKLCRNTPLSQRFDCLPGGEVDQETCESRGCCWLPVQEVRFTICLTEFFFFSMCILYILFKDNALACL